VLDAIQRAAQGGGVIASLVDRRPDGRRADAGPRRVVWIDVPGDVVRAEGLMGGQHATEPVEQVKRAHQEMQGH
jgi:hypothetical protein